MGTARFDQRMVRTDFAALFGKATIARVFPGEGNDTFVEWHVVYEDSLEYEREAVLDYQYQDARGWVLQSHRRVR